MLAFAAQAKAMKLSQASISTPVSNSPSPTGSVSSTASSSPGSGATMLVLYRQVHVSTPNPSIARRTSRRSTASESTLASRLSGLSLVRTASELQSAMPLTVDSQSIVLELKELPIIRSIIESLRSKKLFDAMVAFLRARYVEGMNFVRAVKRLWFAGKLSGGITRLWTHPSRVSGHADLQNRDRNLKFMWNS